MIINNNYTTNLSMGKRSVSPETRAKISAALKGIKRSPETRAKVSAAMKKVRAEHPEITEMHRNALKKAWANLVETRKSMQDFFRTQNIPTQKTIARKKQNKPLSDNAQTIDGIFFKNFWKSHPEEIKPFTQASQEAYKKTKKLL